MTEQRQRTYVCKRSRLCKFLTGQGFFPYSIEPDRSNPNYDVFLFDATPELYKAVVRYFDKKDNDDFKCGGIEENGNARETEKDF